MYDDFKNLGLFSLAELNYLRLEAMDLFERCLTEGKPEYLQAFIEKQISQDPPRLELLRELEEDLHQRLLYLRESHFDVRDRVMRTLREDFQVDVSPLLPAKALENYHRLNTNDLIAYLRRQNLNLTDQEETLVRKLIETSVDIAAQLADDVRMTEYLYHYVVEWSAALNAAAARRLWITASQDGNNYTGIQ